VIFISAMTETLDKVKAFGSGGVDYITKPFQFDEVEARVKTHLSLRNLQLDLMKRYEELRRLESLRDSLIHMLVHDLCSPLAAVMGHLELLQIGADQLNEEQQSGVDEALLSTKTILRMIHSLLDLNRLEAGEMPLNPTIFDLRIGLEQAHMSFGKAARGHHITAQVPDHPVCVCCDAGLIERTITNLIANAIKFTPSGGALLLKVEELQDRVKVSVEDTGPGIPEEYHRKIFDKFGQVQAQQERRVFSTGLGLAFCKLAVEAHGGTIGVDSVVGEGSTFWFQLPKSAEVSSVAR
jgi:signal transduction histidine kinase